jgi:hypothetical protein
MGFRGFPQDCPGCHLSRPLRVSLFAATGYLGLGGLGFVRVSRLRGFPGFLNRARRFRRCRPQVGEEPNKALQANAALSAFEFRGGLRPPPFFRLRGPRRLSFVVRLQGAVNEALE